MIEEELRATFARNEDLCPDQIILRSEIGVGIQRRKARNRRAGLISVAAAIIVILAALPGVARMLAAQPPSPATGTSGTETPRANRPVNLLMLGVDRRPGSSEPARADAIVLAQIPVTGNGAYLVSIPRDTQVDIPGHGRDKINSSYAFGGAKLTETVINRLTGIRIDATAVVDFAGLARLTDSLGGITMCVPYPQGVRSFHTGRVFPVGCQHLDGEQTLDLVRQRINLPRGELDRVTILREYLRGLLKSAADSSLLTRPDRVAGILEAAGDSVQLDLRSLDTGTAISMARRLDVNNLVGITIPVAELPAAAGFQPAEPAASQLFAALRDGSLESWALANPGSIQR